MPRRSDDALLQRAIPAALGDRRAMLDSLAAADPAAAVVRDEWARIRALTGRRLRDCSPAELEAAGWAFRYAEQWERSLADAQVGTRWASASRRAADRYRARRLARWGPTPVEQALAASRPVTLAELATRRPKGE